MKWLGQVVVEWIRATENQFFIIFYHFIIHKISELKNILKEIRLKTIFFNRSFSHHTLQVFALHEGQKSQMRK